MYIPILIFHQHLVAEGNQSIQEQRGHRKGMVKDAEVGRAVDLALGG